MADAFDSVAKLQELRGSKLGTLAQIQTARRAMTLLDSQIMAAEIRLRALPAKVVGTGGVGAGVGGVGSARARMARRRGSTTNGVFAMGENGARVSALRVGKTGIGLSPDALRSGGGAAFLGAAVTAGIVGGLGNQLIDMKEQFAALEEQGLSAGEARKAMAVGGFGAVGRSIADVFGTSSIMKLWQRNINGKSAAEADRIVEDDWRNTFETDAVRNLRVTEKRRRIHQEHERILKQYDDDNTFLDTFTPADFDMFGDYGRDLMRVELREKNRKHINLVLLMRENAMWDNAAKDVRAD